MIFGCGEVNLIDSLLLNRLDLTTLYLSYCEEERRPAGGGGVLRKCDSRFRLRECQELRMLAREQIWKVLVSVAKAPAQKVQTFRKNIVNNTENLEIAAHLPSV